MLRVAQPTPVERFVFPVMFSTTESSLGSQPTRPDPTHRPGAVQTAGGPEDRPRPAADGRSAAGGARRPAETPATGAGGAEGEAAGERPAPGG